MRQALATLAALEPVGPYVRVRFSAPDLAVALAPGRALLSRSTDMYLRRTWWPCSIDVSGFCVLMEAVAAEWYRVGDRVDVLGPVGRGFQIDAASRNLLLVAGPHSPQPAIGPLLALVDRALADSRSVTLAMSREAAYPVSALPPVVEVLHIDAERADLPPDAITWADHVFACGPVDFGARVSRQVRAVRHPAPGRFVQALHLVDLACGTGACGACWNGARLTCIDGPVFTSAPSVP
jgi:hypothetical protein